MAQKKGKVGTAKNPNVTSTTQPTKAVPSVAPPLPTPDDAASPFNFRVQCIVLALVGLLFYGNTFLNTWAYDDSLVILQNEYVAAGFAGIPKILSVDAFESYTRSQNETTNQLSGGRYRPLSLVTFAIEQQLMGLNRVDTTAKGKTEAYAKAAAKKLDRDMHARHVVNVLLFVFSVIVLLVFLRKTIFSAQPFAAFMAAFLFLVHPIHTEVVANIKSRDEILSLLFILLTMLAAFKYREQRQTKHLVLGCLYLLLGLLSKEYGIALVVLLPLAFYTFYREPLQRSLQATWLYLIPVAIYGFMRIKSVGVSNAVIEDVMNIPYLFATPVEALATKLAVLFDYIKLLFVPYPLMVDYTYNQVPYVDFTNYRPIASIILNGGLVYLMVKLLKKRHVMGFTIAWYFAFLALISNFFINVGSTMGERLIYHSSLGFVVGIVWLIDFGLTKWQPERVRTWIGFAVLMAIAIPSGIFVVQRNQQWKSNMDLFLHDVNVGTNSVIIAANAGRASMEKSDNVKDQKTKDKWTQQGIAYLDRAISINPRYVAAYVNRALCYMRLGIIDKALSDCDTINKYYPTHPSLPYIAQPLGSYFTSVALSQVQQGKEAEALVSFKKAAEAEPTNPDYLYNYGFALCKNQQYSAGKAVVSKALLVNPNHVASKQLMEQLRSVQ
jgi:protein O-mannosyl-transferase